MFSFEQPKQQSKANTISIQVQSKPRQQKKRLFFCRLCRQYNINARKAHLKNFHNANPEAMSKRVTDDMLAVLFLECNDE